MITIDDCLRYDGYMRKCCAQYTTDPHQIDEALQETYLWLCEQLHKRGLDFLDWKGEPNKHYLRMIATSKLLDALKYQSRRRERETAYSEMTDEEPEPMEMNEHEPVSRSILEQMEPYDRELLKLVYYRRVTQKELSTTLEIPYVTIKSDVRKAKANFREIWEAEKGETRQP